MMVGMRCPKCGWEGEGSELIGEPTNLKLNDNFTSAFFILAKKRRIVLCPVCRTPLRTGLFMYGIEVESEGIP
jgi:hypothetical protein